MNAREKTTLIIFTAVGLAILAGSLIAAFIY
jgi:hypothetical protein